MSSGFHRSIRSETQRINLLIQAIHLFYQSTEYTESEEFQELLKTFKGKNLSINDMAFEAAGLLTLLCRISSFHQNSLRCGLISMMYRISAQQGPRPHKPFEADVLLHCEGMTESIAEQMCVDEENECFTYIPRDSISKDLRETIDEMLLDTIREDLPLPTFLIHKEQPYKNASSVISVLFDPQREVILSLEILSDTRSPTHLEEVELSTRARKQILSLYELSPELLAEDLTGETENPDAEEDESEEENPTIH